MIAGAVNGGGEGDWQDWRQGECIVPALVKNLFSDTLLERHLT